MILFEDAPKARLFIKERAAGKTCQTKCAAGLDSILIGTLSF